MQFITAVPSPAGLEVVMLTHYTTGVFYLIALVVGFEPTRDFSIWLTARRFRPLSEHENFIALPAGLEPATL